jgi:Flp pilus assembly protein TadB
MATPVLMIIIFISKDRDLHKKVEEREVQMRLDYPEIVSALALLVGAGMTVPNAWKKIAYDYRKRKEEGGEARFAYEEMLITVYEMDSGIMQSVAFERFGKRCRIPSYNKLSTMVSQNIRKGASNLPILLKEEAREAFEDRKHLARKQGEQAGTKLLAPMMLLLILTLVIILVPAFRNYF